MLPDRSSSAVGRAESRASDRCDYSEHRERIEHEAEDHSQPDASGDVPPPGTRQQLSAGPYDRPDQSAGCGENDQQERKHELGQRGAGLSRTEVAVISAFPDTGDVTIASPKNLPLGISSSDGVGGPYRRREVHHDVAAALTVPAASSCKNTVTRTAVRPSLTTRLGSAFTRSWVGAASWY